MPCAGLLLKCPPQQNNPMALCCNQAWLFQCAHSSAILRSPHTLLVRSICAALTSPRLSHTTLPLSVSSSSVHYPCSGARHCPLTHCSEAAWFFFSFTVIYLHHGKQLSSKKSYLSHRSGFIFLSITLHLFLLLLHFFSLFSSRQVQLCGSQGADKL